MRRVAGAVLAACLAAVACASNPMSGVQFACDPDGPSTCLSGWVCVRAEAGHKYKGVCTPAAEVSDPGPSDPGTDEGWIDPGPGDPGVVEDVTVHVDGGPEAESVGPVEVSEDLSFHDDGLGPDDPGPDACVVHCDGRQCGDDGCGGSCGTCSGGKVCESGQCGCKANDHKACCESAVCWYDSCGAQGGKVVDCQYGCDGGTNQCKACIPACSGKQCGDDGCGGDCAPGCTGGKVCASGTCVCVAQDHKACSLGSVYWYDSCEVQGGVAETCSCGCSGAACTCCPTCSPCRTSAVSDGCSGTCVVNCTGTCSGGTCCTPQDHKSCSGGNLYWFDSCSNQGSLAQTCTCGCTGTACTCCPSWSCTGWSACGCGNTQTQTCTDANACGTTTGKPAESQSCNHCGNGTCDCGETNATCPQDGCPSGTVCGGTTCPVVSGYTVSCNGQAHCEYANAVTTGWKAYDVWVHVPAGSFTMGSPSGENGHQSSEDPNHVVTFAKGYLMGKYLVTVLEYEACESASPGTCTAPSVADWGGCASPGLNTSGNGRPTHPQNGLTWDQAGAVCAWRVTQGGGSNGRRPSEAEWEYAAKGPVHRKYPWGDTPEPTCANNTANFSESSCGCGTNNTMPVGSKSAGISWSGALDMAGNVWEWCEDWWHGNYTGAPVDGSAWVDTGSYRVIRGGGFYYVASYLRSSTRLSDTPGYRYASIGARCLRPMP